MAISDLQKTLRKLHRDLIENLEDPARKKNPSALLKGVVGRCDRFFDEMRIPVDLWGEQFVVVEEGVDGEGREEGNGEVEMKDGGGEGALS